MSLWNRIKRILLFPIRVITYPFRRVSAFINAEPEETPTAEVFQKTFEQPSILVDHLEELRRHLLRAVVFLVITTALSFTFARRILEFLTEPIGGIEALRAIEVTESIGAFMRVSLLAGLALAIPYILFEIFLFINPALRSNERKMVIVLLPVGTLLFVGGLAFAYFVMLPAALPFLLNFMGIQAELRPSSYIQFVTSVMFWIGIAFEFPLIIYLLAVIGVVNPRMLWRAWRIAIVAIAVLAAAITPTIDPVNMGLVMAPMIVLYFFSIGLAAIAERGRQRSSAA
jgi:sec-independent protein translocase protein TatC